MTERNVEWSDWPSHKDGTGTSQHVNDKENSPKHVETVGHDEENNPKTMDVKLRAIMYQGVAKDQQASLLIFLWRRTSLLNIGGSKDVEGEFTTCRCPNDSGLYRARFCLEYAENEKRLMEHYSDLLKKEIRGLTSAKNWQ
ncbi:hypothetical protein Tco_0851901 [Tanacetum coccineum]